MPKELIATEKTAAVDTHRVHGVDALRGIAASGVVIIHAIGICPLGVPFYGWSTSYLVLGVPLFFIISAFSMSIAYRTGIGDVGAARRYAIRRILRIAPLFYVMLVAWIVYYKHLGSPFPSFKTLFLNMSFLFGLVPSAQVSYVPAGWSIGVEMLFYALFPVVWLRRGFLPAVVILLVAVTAVWLLNHSQVKNDGGYFYWTNFATNAPYFAIGLVVWWLFSMAITLSARLQRLSGSLALWLGLGLAVIMLLYGPELSGQQVVFDPVPLHLILGWGTAFGLLVLSQALAPVRLLVNPVTRFLGMISYSLHLSHPLLIYSTKVSVWAASLAPNQYLVVPVVAIVTLSCAIPISWLLYTLVEAPFIRLGRRLTTVSWTPKIGPVVKL